MEERIKQSMHSWHLPESKRAQEILLRPLYQGILLAAGERVIALIREEANKEGAKNYYLPWTDSMNTFLQLPYKRAREEFRRHYTEWHLARHPSYRQAAKHCGTSKDVFKATLQRTPPTTTPCPQKQYMRLAYRSALKAFSRGYLHSKLKEHQGHIPKTASASGITTWHLRQMLMEDGDYQLYKRGFVQLDKISSHYGSGDGSSSPREDYEPIVIEELLAFRSMLSRPAGNYLWRQRKLLAGKVLDAVFGAENVGQE